MATDRFLELSIFVQVVQTGSFSKAARSMALSPSTVSKTISRLEQRLGVPLFTRTSRLVRTTPEGRTFFESATQLLNGFDQAESRLREQAPRGLLRIAAHPTVASTLIAPILPKFLDEHEGMRVDVSVWGWPQTSLSTETVESNLDVAIIHGDPPDSSMIGRKIGVSRRVVCASPSYLARHGTPEAPDDLLRHNCLFGPVFQNYWPLADAGEVRRLHVSGNVTSNYSELLRRLALSGLGIVRLPHFYVRDDVTAGRLVPLLTENHVPEVEPIFALYQRERGLVPRVKTFINFLASEIRPLLDSE